MKGSARVYPEDGTEDGDTLTWKDEVHPLEPDVATTSTSSNIGKEDLQKDEDDIKGSVQADAAEVGEEDPPEDASNQEYEASFCSRITRMFCDNSGPKNTMQIVEDKYGIPLRRGKKLRQAFRQLDQNGNGYISREELVVGMQQFTGCFSDDDDAVDAAMLADTDGDGMLGYEEFVVWIVSVAILKPKSNSNDPLLLVAKRCGFQ